MRITFALLAIIALATVAPAQKKEGQWAEGVPYTTSWDDAIAAVRSSGKLLFIYNGWENKDI